MCNDLSTKLQVRVRRIQIFPLFEDYDRVHIGSVTRSQVNKGGFIDVYYFYTTQWGSMNLLIGFHYSTFKSVVWCNNGVYDCLILAGSSTEF